MKRQFILVMIVLLLIAQTVHAYGLAQYPWIFADKGTFDAYFIIGEHAPALDVVSATELSSALSRYPKIKQQIGSAIIDTEFNGNIAMTNAIVIGSPCENKIAAELEGNPLQCDEGLEAGKGYVKFFEDRRREFQQGEKHYNQILITGKTAEDRHKAAVWLANKPDTWFSSEHIVMVERKLPKEKPKEKQSTPVSTTYETWKKQEETIATKPVEKQPDMTQQPVEKLPEMVQQPVEKTVLKTYEFSTPKKEILVVKMLRKFIDFFN